jgi:hypothetical protein
MELEPARGSFDVIARRVQEATGATGAKPILASTGKPVDFCAGSG